MSFQFILWFRLKYIGGPLLFNVLVFTRKLSFFSFFFYIMIICALYMKVT